MDVLWGGMALGCLWDYEGEVSLEPKGDALPSLGPPNPDQGSVTCRAIDLPRRADGRPRCDPSATQILVHPHSMTPLHTHAHGPCDFCPHPQHVTCTDSSPELAHSLAAPSLHHLPVPPPGNCLGAAPAWPLAGISPAVAALSLGPLEQLQEEELVGMAQAPLRPPPLCVQPGPSCFAMPALGSRPSADPLPP